MSKRLALHVEPLFPDFHQEWFKWAIRIRQAVMETDQWHATVVVGHRFREQARSLCSVEEFDQLVFVDLSYVTDTLKLDGHDAVRDIYLNNSSALTESMLEHFATALDGMYFDVVMSWSPVEYYKILFPGIVTIYSEIGPFAKFPFGSSWFIDPAGPLVGAALRKFQSECLSQLPDFREQLKVVNRIRQIVKRSIMETSPYTQLLVRLRKKYKSIFLLPLQSATHYLFQALTTIRTTQELIATVAAKLPTDTALLVTCHPFGDNITDQIRVELKKKFPFLIFIDPLPIEFGPSDYITAEVDCVITVSSKVAFLALLHGKPLVSLSDGFMGCFPMLSWDEVGDATQLSTNNEIDISYLYWLLTHYNVPEEIFFSKSYLFSLLNRCLTSELYTSAFIKPFSDDRSIVRYIRSSSRSTSLPLWTGQDISDLPRVLLKQIEETRRAEVDLTAGHHFGNSALAELLYPLMGEALILTRGSFGLNSLGKTFLLTARIGFKFCIDLAEDEWTAMFWAGDATIQSLDGRTFTVHFNKTLSCLAISLALRNGKVETILTPENSISLGRWCHLEIMILEKPKTLIVFLDGKISYQSALASDMRNEVNDIFIGKDPLFPTSGSWLKVCHLYGPSAGPKQST